MISKREQVLQRLRDIMTEQYVAAETVVRNRKLLREDVRPAIAILDGDERARLTGDGQGRGNFGRQRMTFQLMTMTPQVFVIPKGKLPMNENEPMGVTNIGTDANELIDIIIHVVAQDEELLTIVGNNGSIAYLGMETDLKSSGTLDGQCRLDFAFTYLLDPSEPL